MERVSFFDFATRLTGWCSGAGDTAPDADFVEFDHHGKDLGALGFALWEFLDNHIAVYRPTCMGYEAPILVVNAFDEERGHHTDKLSTLRPLYGMGFLFETYCRMHGIPCGEESPQALKKEATGNRWAKKEEVAAAIEARGIILPSGPGRLDAGDASAGWLIGIRENNPEQYRRWVLPPAGTLL